MSEDAGHPSAPRRLMVALFVGRLAGPPAHQLPDVVESHVVFEQIAP